jgi:hypothetical protein
VDKLGRQCCLGHIQRAEPGCGCCPQVQHGRPSAMRTGSSWTTWMTSS